MPEPAARRRIDWGVLGVEAAAIFLSVLLGFGVAEWRDARAEARTVEHALAAYADEIAGNQRRVAQGVAYHRAVSAALFARLAEPAGGQNLFEALDEAGWQGPRQVVFRNAARATAEATDVLGLLPFNHAAALVALYNAQDELDVTEQSLADAAFNPAVLDDANVDAALRSVSVYFQMVVEQEQNLLRGYRQTIETLGLDLVPAADSLLTET